LIFRKYNILVYLFLLFFYHWKGLVEKLTIRDFFHFHWLIDLIRWKRLKGAKKSKLFLVLSLHRSGSSATAGVLNHLGVHMGDHLLGADYSNPKGHFENTDFLKVNEKILGSVGARWSTPPSRETIISSNFPKSEIRSFLLSQVKPVWGLKDPRTTLTFDIWKSHLEEIADVTYVFVWRSLEESILSLAERHKYDLCTAREILTSYLDNLMSYRDQLEKENKDIVDIHFTTLLESPEDFIKEINQRINQNPDHNLDLIKKFLDKQLKHF
jgi:hypothetical protein